jgi:hypothetical protein
VKKSTVDASEAARYWLVEGKPEMVENGKLTALLCVGLV